MYSLGEMGTGLITRQFFKLGSTVLEIAPKKQTTQKEFLDEHIQRT